MSEMQKDSIPRKNENRRGNIVPQERVLVRTGNVNGPEANVNVKGSNDGGSTEVPSTKKRWKGEKRTGKVKDKWSHQERRILWECYVRSGAKRSGGYIKKVKEMWDGRDLN